MNQTHKTEVHVAVHAAIVDVTGKASDPAQGASVQVIINEVTEGNWAAHGRAISLAAIADTVGTCENEAHASSGCGNDLRGEGEAVRRGPLSTPTPRLWLACFADHCAFPR